MKIQMRQIVAAAGAAAMLVFGCAGCGDGQKTAPSRSTPRAVEKERPYGLVPAARVMEMAHALGVSGPISGGWISYFPNGGKQVQVIGEAMTGDAVLSDGHLVVTLREAGWTIEYDQDLKTGKLRRRDVLSSSAQSEPPLILRSTIDPAQVLTAMAPL